MLANLARALVRFILAVMEYKDYRYEFTIKVILFIAGIFGVIAFFSGTNQFDFFIDNPADFISICRVVSLSPTITSL